MVSEVIAKQAHTEAEQLVLLAHDPNEQTLNVLIATAATSAVRCRLLHLVPPNSPQWRELRANATALKEKLYINRHAAGCLRPFSAYAIGGILRAVNAKVLRFDETAPTSVGTSR